MDEFVGELIVPTFATGVVRVVRVCPEFARSDDKCDSVWCRVMVLSGALSQAVSMSR